MLAHSQYYKVSMGARNMHKDEEKTVCANGQVKETEHESENRVQNEQTEICLYGGKSIG